MNEKLYQEMLNALKACQKSHSVEGGEFYFEFDEEYQILIDGLHALKVQQTGEHIVVVDGVEYTRK